MERASFFSNLAYSRIYRHTVSSSTSPLWWLFAWWLWSGNHCPVDGIDGEGESALYDDSITVSTRKARKSLNRASNKPHAVLADGAAMQRVPGSLRFLTKTCREANVPLYVLNDPRSWGGTTHKTLPDAIVDLRHAVSDNIVRNALELREGSAFERGRILGRWEKEVAWQAWDAGRKTSEY